MRIVLCGGGTAGHVNPALAVAEEIIRQDKNNKVLFIGRRGGKENTLITNAGFSVETIEIQGIKRQFTLENFERIKNAFKAKKEAEKIIQSFNPDIILGTGGYVCWPVISAGHSLGIPTSIHESNIIPGLTTKLLSLKSDLILLNHKTTGKRLIKSTKTVVVGNPLRSDFMNGNRITARKKLNLKEDDIFILSFGGSIGSEKLNQCSLNLMKHFSSKQANVMHVHASGERYFEKIKNAGSIFENQRCEVKPYIHNMSEMMYAADIVICRCGAMTLSELSHVGVSSILIPSPNVTGNHQLKNAKHLSDMGAAILIEEKNLNSEVLIKTVKDIKNDKSGRKKRAKIIKSLSYPNSTELIINELNLLINGKKTV